MNISKVLKIFKVVKFKVDGEYLVCYADKDGDGKASIEIRVSIKESIDELFKGEK